MKTIFVSLIIPTLLFLIQQFVFIYNNKSVLENPLSIISFYKDNIGLFIISVSVILFFIGYQFFVISKPYRRFKIFHNTRSKLISVYAEIIQEELRNKKIELRINVMIPKVMFYSNGDNKNKFKFFRKEFVSIWTSDNMQFEEDRELKLTINQGVCGEAFRSKSFKFADLTVENPEDYNLNENQIEKTKDLKYIFSCPIKKIEEKDLTSNPQKVIGVINFDSKSEDVGIITENDYIFKSISKKIKSFSYLCSYIL